MAFSPGNNERDTMIANAIRKLEAREQPINLHTVTPRLPHGFELDLTELNGIMSNLHPVEVEFEEPAGESLRSTWPPNNVSVPVEDAAELNHDPITGGVLAGPPPKPLQNFEPPYANETGQPHHESAKATPQPKISHADALAAVQQAERAITDNRYAVRAMTDRVRELRGKLHAAVVAYQSGGVRYTPLQQARDFAATSQAERAKRLADVPAELRSKYGSAAAFTRKIMRNGPSRGAVSQAGRARLGFVAPGSPAALTQAAARAAKVT